MNTPLSRSLSLRLLAIFALTALLLVALLIASFTHGLSSQWQRSIGPHLAQYVRYVQRDLGSPPELERARRLSEALPMTIAIYRDGRFVGASGGGPLDLDAMHFRRLPRRLARRLSAGNAESVGEGRESGGADRDTATTAPMRAAIAHEGSREAAVLRIEQGRDTVYYTLRPPRGNRGAMSGDGLYVTLPTIALVLLGSWLLIRRQLAPIGEIQRGVRRISGGELAHRIDPGGRDDLAELGRSIDDMAERLGAMLDAKRQLLLAVSHELRSPLARARVACALLPPSRQRERLEADLADMARLIADLTESERLRTPHAALQLEPLDLAALLADEIAVHGLAPRLIGTDDGTLPLLADGARLRVLVRNLVGNALRHGRGPDGEADVTVTLTRRADAAVLEIADRGSGIAPAHLDKVTEPFYRPDEARTRGDGGVGLGLSLARLVAEAHGGTLTLDSDSAREPGTRAIVTLPLGTLPLDDDAGSRRDPEPDVRA